MLEQKNRLLSIGLIIMAAQVLSPTQAAQEPGTWQNITPSAIDLTKDQVYSVRVDPLKKSDCWAFITSARGCVWKSTDYGATWTHINVGLNSDKTNGGCPWYTAMDLDPNRNPALPPTLYMAQGYGSMGIWKSTNGGIDWTQTFSGNIFTTDGMTNISSDVGMDPHTIHIVDPAEPNHLTVTLHSYNGTGNNGIFETTDGGAKWIVKKSMTFSFQNHEDLFFPIDGKTWIVWHGQPYPTSELYRTTDCGLTWTKLSGSFDRNFGRQFVTDGSSVYASSTGGLWRSTDKGITWTRILDGNTTCVMPTANYLYAFSGNVWDKPNIRRAAKTNLSSWTALPSPDAMTGSSDNDYGVTFDGTNYILLKAAWGAGLWRYVEPAVSSNQKNIPSDNRSLMNNRHAARYVTTGDNRSNFSDYASAPMYDLRGQKAGKSARTSSSLLIVDHLKTR